MDEKEFQKNFFEHLRNISLCNKIELELACEVQIPHQIIFTPNIDKETALLINCYKQDICYFKSLKKSNKENQARLIKIEINEDGEDRISETQKAKIKIPYLIIETKNGKKQGVTNFINTNDILCYVEKARKIKEIFPWCKYVLLVNGTVPDKVYKIGQTFDAILNIENFREDELLKTDEKIKTLLREAIEYAKRI